MNVTKDSLAEVIIRLQQNKCSEKLDNINLLKTEEPGYYSSEDTFIGTPTPKVRQIATEFRKLPLKELDNFMQSEIYEVRLVALIILVNYCKKTAYSNREVYFRFYLKHLDRINSIEMVDVSAHYIYGDHLTRHPFKIALDELTIMAKADNHLYRRVAVIACFAFVKKYNFLPIFELIKLMKDDKEEHILKALGWVLREVGKISAKDLQEFIDNNIDDIPRVILRIAVDKLPARMRKYYLNYEPFDFSIINKNNMRIKEDV